MPDSPLIFVSHSSKDKELTEQFCEALRAGGAGEASCDALVDYEKLDYKVLVDVDELQAGKFWPKQLHEWMARCHAAVLLLTSNAVKSDWVLKEATILAWRLSLDENFRFFIVRSDDVKDADLTARGFDPLMLGKIQNVPVGTPAEIAAQVRKDMPAIDDTPFDSLCGALQDLAQDVKPNTLRRVAKKMGLGARPSQPGIDDRSEYVQAIAAKLLSEDLGGYEGVDDLVNDLIVTTDKEYVEKILEIVAPHWVDATAAGRLPSVAKSESRCAIAMNGAALSDFTANMYVRRAYPLSRRETVFSVPSANSGDMVDHVTQEIYRYAQRKKRLPVSSEASKEEQKAAVIKHFEKDKLRYFVVLSDPHPSKADLKELMTRFPKLTFILGTEDELPDPEPEGVVCLKPEVDLEEEERQRAAYEAAMDIIRNSP